MAEYTTIRIWTSTLENLRVISAATDETAVEVLDRLVGIELGRIDPSGQLQAIRAAAKAGVRPLPGIRKEE